MFVDRARVHLRAGNGGAGVASFERIKGKPRGRPSGGSGGRGGDVVVTADRSMATLLTYHRQPHHAATNGSHGEGDNRHGRRGESLSLPVPPGTQIRDEEGTLLADLVTPGSQVTVLKGGRGGRGNAALVSPRLRIPAIAEQGEFGPKGWFDLELKLMVDAALVGFPNAGKSTLISSVSAAHPEIADYPFTTLQPHPGVVEVDDRQFVLVDIPGLIEGAAEGRGLGHEFLRHVERARVLVFLLDPSPLAMHPPAQQLRILLDELRRYSPELLDRPRVVAVNKSDLGEANEVPDAFSISAVTGQGITKLLHRIADLVDQSVRLLPEREGFVLHRPRPPGFSVRRDGATWIVEGVAAQRAVAFSDLTNPQAADEAARRLRRLGVDDALAAAGAVAGDDVKIGELVFEFSPEV